MATVANIAVLLKSIAWNGFGIADPVWMAIILVVATAIAAVTMYRIRNVGYGLALVVEVGGVRLGRQGASSSTP